jgi:hypothetical protein
MPANDDGSGLMPANPSDIILTSKIMSHRRELHLLPVVSRANLFAD